MLKVKNLSKSFSDHKVLDNVSFNLDEIGIIGLAGASGSGKSTLLRLIQGLEIPDSGTIDSNLTTGFMFQDFQLFPHMTIWDNIIYAPRLHKKENYIKRAKEIIKGLGLATKTNSYPAQLSGGQKQRAALARSLIMRPDLLLCDEPTSGLDITSTGDVAKLLKSVRDMGLAVIVASHDLEFLAMIACKIIILKDGKIHSEISVEKLKNPVAYLKKIY